MPSPPLPPPPAVGVSMTLSICLCDRQDGGEQAVVAQQCPQDADASAGQGDDGLDVFEPFGALLEVEVAVGPVTDDAGLRGQVEHPAQLAAIALGPVQV